MNLERISRKSVPHQIEPKYEDGSRSTMSKPGSLLDEGIRAEIDRLSDDSDYDCDRYAISIAIGTS